MDSPTRPLSRAAIDTWQGAQLGRLIGYCRERSAFYRRKLAESTAAVRGLEDLAALPLTTGAELRAHGADMVCVSQDAVARVISLHSSGTTGPAKRLWFTEADLERTLAFFHLGMGQMVEPGERAAILLPGATPDSTGDLLARALERLGVASTILGLCPDPVRAAQAVQTLRPAVLVGFPVQVLALARMAVHLGLELPPLRTVLLCSDYIPKSLAHSVRELLGSEVFSHYGTAETGLGGAVDCAAHEGCHLREGDLLVEIIDPHTTLPMADSTWGEIVCTTLTAPACRLSATAPATGAGCCPACAAAAAPSAGSTGCRAASTRCAPWHTAAGWPWPSWTNCSSPCPGCSIAPPPW